MEEIIGKRHLGRNESLVETTEIRCGEKFWEEGYGDVRLLLFFTKLTYLRITVGPSDTVL